MEPSRESISIYSGYFNLIQLLAGKSWLCVRGITSNNQAETVSSSQYVGSTSLAICHLRPHLASVKRRGFDKVDEAKDWLVTQAG